MPSTLRYEQREAALEEYVQREALAVLLQVLTANSWGSRLGKDLGLDRYFEALSDETANELSVGLWDRLWPDDADERAGDYPGCPEEEIANARAAAIAATVLARFAANPAALAEAASRLSGAASRGLTPEAARA